MSETADSPVPPAASELLTTEEVAARLKVSPKTLSKWRTRGTGPPYFKVGRCVRYQWEAVQAWLAPVRTEASRAMQEARTRWQRLSQWPPDRGSARGSPAEWNVPGAGGQPVPRELVPPAFRRFLADDGTSGGHRRQRKS